MPKSKLVTVTITTTRDVDRPECEIGDALDILAQHITFEHKHGSKTKSQDLAVVRDQLSTLRARWGCR